MNKSTFVSTFLYYIFTLIVIYGTLLPVIAVVLYGIGGKGSDDTAAYLLRGAHYLYNSLLLAVPVTLTATFFAVLLSFTLWRFKFKGIGFFRVMALSPLLNPPFVGSLSFIMLFGKRGLITHDLLHLSVSPFGYWGVFIMQIISLTTLGYLFISSGVQNMQTIYEEAARTCGMSERKILTTVTLPLLKPEILGGMLLIFLASMADFGTPLIIGGPFQTLSSDLYIQITGTYDMRGASISGALLLVPCLMAFILQKKILKKRAYWGRDLQKYDLLYPHPSKRVQHTLIAICAIFFGMLILKYGFIIIGAFTNNWGHDYSFTLRHFVKLNEREWLPFVNSVKLSVGVGLGSALLGVLCADIIYKRKAAVSKWLEIVGTLPAAVPGILFGIGYLVTFKYPLFGISKFYWLSGPRIILLGTSIIIYIICIFRYMNVGLRSGMSVLAHLDPNIEQAAHTLGASKVRTFFTISLPLLKPAFQIAYMKIFASTMTTLGAIIFLLLPKNKVAVQQIFQIITSSEIGLGAAMSLSLSALMGVLMLAFYLLMHGKGILMALWRKNNEYNL
ncbi:MAG: iron ABC transporter permease [Clostridia bacterium]|nr:iron ABC transporter permease [Clostridia bacterium]